MRVFRQRLAGFRNGDLVDFYISRHTRALCVLCPSLCCECVCVAVTTLIHGVLTLRLTLCDALPRLNLGTSAKKTSRKTETCTLDAQEKDRLRHAQGHNFGQCY